MVVIDDRVVHEVTIAAPRDLVFGYFTDPELLVQWKGSDATLDPQPGGVYRCHVTDTAVAVGEYVTVSPYDLVSFTWGWEGDSVLPPGSSTVIVTFSDVPEGTLVRLEHTRLPAPQMALHDEGWSLHLPQLVRAVESATEHP